ncbi:DUF2274 domain-containing protein [Pectobacterium cacticida]
MWLGPPPKTESTKLTFACPISLKDDLDRYAQLHSQTHSEAVDAVTLIPHLLETFMTGKGIQEEVCSSHCSARIARTIPGRCTAPRR